MADYDLSPHLGLQLPIKGNGAPYSQNVLRSNFSKIDTEAQSADTRLDTLELLSSPSVGSDAERDLRFPTPAQGTRVWRTDKLLTELYYANFNSVSNPAGANGAGWYPAGPFPTFNSWYSYNAASSGALQKLLVTGTSISMNAWPFSMTQGITDGWLSFPYKGDYEVSVRVRWPTIGSTAGQRNIGIASGSGVSELGGAGIISMAAATTTTGDTLQDYHTVFRCTTVNTDKTSSAGAIRPTLTQNSGSTQPVGTAINVKYLGPGIPLGNNWSN